MTLDIRIFTKSEILFLTEHTLRDDSEETAQWVKERLSDTLGTLDIKDSDGYEALQKAVQQTHPERIITIPVANGDSPVSSLSFVPVSITREGVDKDGNPQTVPRYEDDELLGIMTEIAGAANLLNNAAQYKWNPYIIYQDSYAPVLGDQGFILRTVGPNWYNPASNGDRLPTGGPGGKPIDALSQTTPGFGLPNVFGSSKSSSSPVDVFVLDTLPSEEAISELKSRIQASASTPHPTLAALLNPRITTWDYDHTVRNDGSLMMDYLNNQQTSIEFLDHSNPASTEHFKIADHGLFIGGMIHELTQAEGASNVRLHLVQILGDYGIGTLETLVNGLKAVLDHHDRETQTLVNCSFTLATPRRPDLDSGHFDENRWFGGKLPANWKSYVNSNKIMVIVPPQVVYCSDDKTIELPIGLLELSLWFVEILMGMLRQKGVAFVAAAGNDRELAKHPSTQEPGAGYPAAFYGIIGISAMDDKNVTASKTTYSNLADKPPCEGFAVFGGVKKPDGFTNSGKGVSGVYIGDLPPVALGAAGHPSANKRALWAGTSFAAPIITALLAVGAAKGNSLPVAIEKLHIFASTTTPGGEPIVPLV